MGGLELIHAQEFDMEATAPFRYETAILNSNEWNDSICHLNRPESSWICGRLCATFLAGRTKY